MHVRARVGALCARTLLGLVVLLLMGCTHLYTAYNPPTYTWLTTAPQREVAHAAAAAAGGDQVELDADDSIIKNASSSSSSSSTTRNEFEDAGNTTWEHPAWITRCWDNATLRVDPTNYSSIPVEHLSDLKQTGLGGELVPLTLDSSQVPYIYVLPILTGDCPAWFEANLESASYVQNNANTEMSKSKDPAVQKVILVEGGQPKCAEACLKHGVTHVSVPDADLERYWQLIIGSYPGNFGLGHGDANSGHRNNLWLQSIMRYLLLNHVVQSSGLRAFVYLDWDTTVYIPSIEAWSILVQRGHVQIASCVYPPFGTANNIYVMFTRDGMRSFVDFALTTMLTRMSPECWEGHHLSFFTGAVPSDMDFVLMYFAYQSRREVPLPDEASGPRGWLLNAKSFSSAGNSEDGASNRCSNLNVTCGEDSRWRFAVGSEWGQLYPPWKLRPPEYDMFNLCEPFGDGNMVSELPFQAGRPDGPLSPHPLWDYTHDGTKAFTWDNDRLYMSRRKPTDSSAPMWGWFNDVATKRTQMEDSTQVNFFRVWAVHFGTSFKTQIPSYSAKSRRGVSSPQVS